MATDEELREELASIRKSLDAAEQAVRDDAEERRKENEKRDQRIAASENSAKWSKRAVVAALVVAVLSLLVGFTGLVVGASAKATTADIIDTRTESRAATCRSDNAFIANHNALVTAVENAASLAAAPPPGGRSTEEQARVDQFLADYVATVEQSRVPPRDCSPQAIELFYRGGK